MSALGSAFAWLGRRGSVVIALGVFIGLALPPLASLLRPLLIPAIVAPFLVAMLRLDWQLLLEPLRQPGRAALAVVWLLAVLPLLIHLAIQPLGLPPGLHAGMVLMGAAPPLMASANIALMLGLDAPLAVFLTVVGTALMPLTLPALALLLLGIQIDIAALALTLRLGLIVGGCFITAWLLRRLLPQGFTVHHADALDGAAVLGLLVFAIAIMDGVTGRLIAEPGVVLSFALAVYMLNLGLQALGTLAFARRGRREALTLGLCSGNANLGILLAALAERADLELVLFVAVGQLPIYTLPVVQRWLYRRILEPEGSGAHGVHPN